MLLLVNPTMHINWRFRTDVFITNFFINNTCNSILWLIKHFFFG